MKVRHATLLNVIGRPAKHAGFTIVAAEVELEGSAFSPSFPLADQPAHLIPPVLRVPIKKQYDVAWVRARLPHAFGISPEPSEAEKSLLWVGFVAIPDGEPEGAAFWCADYYGKTALMFSDAEMDEAAKEKAANAFWDFYCPSQICSKISKRVSYISVLPSPFTLGVKMVSRSSVRPGTDCSSRHSHKPTGAPPETSKSLLQFQIFPSVFAGKRH
jgi:hypothetical protein